jgi:hypothetical protein
MKRTKAICVGVVAVFALSAMVAASAQAAKPLKGPVPFTDTGEGSAELGTKVINIKCTNHSAVGVMENATGGTVTAKYEGCEVVGKGVKCGNVAASTIETHLLRDELGWIDKSKGEVGSDFKPASGLTLADFNCAGLTKVAVYGSVIGKVSASSVNVMSTEGKTAFEGAGFKNNPEKFESEPTDILETEFPELTGPNVKTSSEQKQADTVHNTPVKSGKKSVANPAEINTVFGAKPMYGRCNKGKGQFTNPTCTAKAIGKAKGKYEFVPLPG